MAQPRAQLVASIKEELQRVGVDAFCARRVRDYPDIAPFKLLRAIVDAQLVQEEHVQHASRAARPLSEHELQVLRLIADGMLDAEIAFKRGKSLYTVKTQIRRILAKLQAKNKAHAVHLAHQRGVL